MVSCTPNLLNRNQKNRDCFFSHNNAPAPRRYGGRSGDSMKLPAFFEEDRAAVEKSLDLLLPPEGTFPPVIHRAMRYSVFAGGKRIRPILCLESGRLFGGEERNLLRLASAIELIH